MKPETENNGLCIDHHKDGTCVRCGRDVDTDDQECIGDRPMTVDIETLAEHVADTLWLSAFADAIDRAHEDGHDVAELRAGPGEDWKDSPYRPVPAAVQKQAADALARIPADVLQQGATAWLEASGCDEDRLGHCLAMEMLGAGVGLFDDIRAADAPIGGAIELLSKAVPYLECYAEYNPETGKVEQ